MIGLNLVGAAAAPALDASYVLFAGALLLALGRVAHEASTRRRLGDRVKELEAGHDHGVGLVALGFVVQAVRDTLSAGYFA